jgi:hypothetical protein
VREAVFYTVKQDSSSLCGLCDTLCGLCVNPEFFTQSAQRFFREVREAVFYTVKQDSTSLCDTLWGLCVKFFNLHLKTLAFLVLPQRFYP